MTESKGPERADRATGPGKKKRRGPLERLRPYAIGIVAMAVVFGGSALIGAHVRATKDDKVKTPNNAAGPAVVPTGPSDSASPTPTPSGPKLDLPVHPSVPVTVTIYEDLRDPASKAFADEYQPVLDQLLTTGQAQLHYRLVTASDKKYGGHGSEDAAAAAACAQDQGRFVNFVVALFKNQPDPTSSKLSSQKFLKDMARRAHKIKPGTFDPCLEQRDHIGWVEKSQAQYASSGYGDVPVVLINGKQVKDVQGKLTPSKLHSMVLAEAKRVIKIEATPSPTDPMKG
ncbi:thioredoxin domain-containing protein [Actinacidiphila sp. DG2A-62]|jgi:protein-disulfide isomerase|uniref:DsbA family protein n=1 Tax=Actinacidiphila sp. DG2A-62 TaxID=3108821 RepID=UPI002DBBFB52|nr:thioredoxin domain-containing protein [Actinacidiphila sp. DG2A-62]MEC3997689.1 thioredoxin domain-containing protein [Actinacidiphila sp. DG2A-62]